MERAQKIEAAKRLINDEGIMMLLTEYLLEPEETLNPELITKHDDLQLGQIARAGIVAEAKIKERFGRIKNLSVAKK